MFGGLGQHVYALTQQQVTQGLSVSVVTLARDPRVPLTGEGEQPAPVSVTDSNGVRVIRVQPGPPFQQLTSHNLLTWVDSMQQAMDSARTSLDDTFEVVHAHDWLVGEVAQQAATEARLPLVSTMHATEQGRHQGWLPTDTSREIHHREYSLLSASDEVITCSRHMRNELLRYFASFTAPISVIPNGIDLSVWRTAVGDATLENSLPDMNPQLVVFCGRLEWEKGIHTLLDAFGSLARTHPNARLVVAGQGSQQSFLVERAAALGIESLVNFVGWLPLEQLTALMMGAACVVIPSLYEPFGVVALEAAALGAPLIVSDTGGLIEFVTDGVTGRTFAAGDDAQLCRVLQETLDNPAVARQMLRAAHEQLRLNHQWVDIASSTTAVYEHGLANAPRIV